MKDAWNTIEHFWFRPISSVGFGLMRVAVGVVALMSWVPQWDEIIRYYTDDGLIPTDIVPYFVRSEYRFSIFDTIGDPSQVYALYILLLIALFFVTIGAWTRISLIISTVLIFSFHERMPILLAGGDTMLRLLLFILLISPCHRSFSFWSLRKRYAAFKAKKSDPKKTLATMSIWPWRLLLWQYICIYIGSVWTKLLGTMWEDGSAVAIALHHEHFNRFPMWFLDMISPLGQTVSYFLLISQAAWSLLLIVPIISWIFPKTRVFIKTLPLRRTIILASFLTHLAIAILMDVGIFSFIMFSGYLGLLLQEDFDAMRQFMNGAKKIKPIIVLYDGTCGLCTRSVFLLTVADALNRFQYEDFRNATKRKKYAPDIPLKNLDQEIHMLFPDGSVEKGFFAFRRALLHLPLLWILVPIVYLPGMKVMGPYVYENIAKRRFGCKDGDCAV